MGRFVKVNADNVQLPNGSVANTNDVVYLTEEQFAQLGASALGDEVSDLGTELGSEVISIPITLAAITAAGDVVTGFVPGFAGRIVSMAFVVTVPATTAAKLLTLNAEIGTTNVTGGAIALTSANCTPLGAVVTGTAVTGNSDFDDNDAISIEAAAVTAFVEGEGVLLITVDRS